VKPGSITCEECPYPYPSSYLPLTLYGQDVRVAYMDVAPQGQPNGHTVVLLHGNNFAGFYFGVVIDALRQEGFRVIVPDQIGYGRSSKPIIPYNLADMARNTRSILQSLNISKAMIVGHSMGGMLAARFATQYPDVVERLVLFNPIGLTDTRVPAAMEHFGDDDNPALACEVPGFRVFQVRWPVLDGVNGEGLLLEPNGTPRGFVVALPDADQTPEQATGLAPGVAAEAQFARYLAAAGFEVIVPVLIDRGTPGSGNPRIAMTNEPHREWIHRQAYMMGRHIIGYEVQKTLSAIDWFEKRRPGKPVGVAGYGEGGLIAFYAAAADPRIHAALVSGYFKPRQQTADEPLYRNVWGLLREFGDAEIATLIAPRGLVVETRDEPKVEGPPQPVKDQKKCAAPGRLWTPAFDEVKAEFNRIGTLIPSGFQPRSLVNADRDALAEFVKMLGVSPLPDSQSAPPADRRKSSDAGARQLRQVKELEAHIWMEAEKTSCRTASPARS